MEAKQIRLLWATAVFTFGLSLIGAAPLAGQGNCQAVDEAMNKVMTTPTHIYSSMTFISGTGGTSRTDKAMYTETIYVGESAYVKVGGKWSRSDWTPQQVMKQEQENRQKSKYTCRFLRDESVNGETAAVYSTQAERSEGSLGQMKSDGQIWISRNKGLPLRQEFDIESGGSGKQHHSVRYEYTNVQPPL